MEGFRPTTVYAPKHFDDRGSVYCPLDNLDDKEIRRTYVVSNYSVGLIRAWHGHSNGWTGLHVIRGAAKIIAKNMNMEESDVTTVVLSEQNPGIFWIPPGFYNGTMSLTDDTQILVYSTHTFESVKDDDVRLKLSTEDRRLFDVTFR